MRHRATSESGREKRRELRYPFSCDIRAHELPSFGPSTVRKGLIRGTVKDISSGGLSLLTDRALKPSAVIRCEIRIGDLPVAIPILSQVRWVQKNSGTSKYRIGLQFLL